VVSLSNRERRLLAERSPFDPAAAAGLRANERTHVTVIAPRTLRRSARTRLMGVRDSVSRKHVSGRLRP